MPNSLGFDAEYVTEVKGIFYEEEELPEALEFIFTSGRSRVLTSATDWTLRSEPGSWPTLPSWCYPKSSWSFKTMHDNLGNCVDTIPEEGLGGMLTGVTLQFPGVAVFIASGEQIMVRFSTR